MSRPGSRLPNEQKFFGSFFKKEQNFFLKKEAKTFVNWYMSTGPER